MRRPLPALLGSAALVLASLAMLSGADAAEPTAAPVIYRATLLGANEVPPGTTAGSGVAAVTVDAEAGQVCLALSVDGIALADVTQVHVHKGVAGANGPVVVGFTVAERTCATGVADTVINDILADPAGTTSTPTPRPTSAVRRGAS